MMTTTEIYYAFKLLPVPDKARCLAAMAMSLKRQGDDLGIVIIHGSEVWEPPRAVVAFGSHDRAQDLLEMLKASGQFRDCDHEC